MTNPTTPPRAPKERETLAEILANADKTIDTMGWLTADHAHTLWLTALHCLGRADCTELARSEAAMVEQMRADGEERLARLAEWTSDIYADRTTAENYLAEYVHHELGQLRSDIEQMNATVPPMSVRAIEGALKAAQSCFSHLLPVEPFMGGDNT